MKNRILAVFPVLLLAVLAGCDRQAKSTPPTNPNELVVAKAAWEQKKALEKRQIAEELGEKGAETWAKDQGYVAILQKADKCLPYGLDQIYRDKDGNIIGLEAKGGNGPLGTTTDGLTQGTPEWAVKTAMRVVESPSASAVERRANLAVLEAANERRLIVTVVRTLHVDGLPSPAKPLSSIKAGAAEGAEAARFLDELPAAMRLVRSSSSQLAGPTEASRKVAGELGSVAKVGKAVTTAGVVVDVAIRVDSAVNVEKQFRAGAISNEERLIAHAKNGVGCAGAYAGAWAGAKCGAAVGATIGGCFAGVGAPAGAAIGGVLGGIAGYLTGEYLGEMSVDGARRLLK
jgi:hypothetical protein